MVTSSRCIALGLGASLVGAFAQAQPPACPAQWTQAVPAFNPLGRTECVLIDAPLLGNGVGGVLLFGGFVSIPGNPPTNFTLNDTQIWNGTNWVTYNGSTAPTARRGAAAAFDSTRSRVVMYGGNQATGLGFSELWVFNGTSWTQIDHPAASLPGPRFRASMVFDPVRDRFVMFGGVRSTTPGNNKLFDTWELSASSVGLGAPIWTLVEASSETSPANADYFPAVYDPQRGVTLAVSYTSTFSQAFGAAHEWNGTAWSKRDTTAELPPRSGFGLTHDGPRGRTILYGGTNGVSGQRYGDTWEFDGSHWLQTRTSLQGPGNASQTYLRQVVAIAYDSRFQKTVHFSGATAPISSTANDTWLYSSAPAPSIVLPPQNTTVQELQTASLVASVSTTTGGTGAFQWLRDGEAVSDGAAGASAGGGVVSGAAGTLAAGTMAPLTLQISQARAGDAGEYRLRITSACGAPGGATSQGAALVVNTLPPACPSIEGHPGSASAFSGSTATLTATVAAPAGVEGGSFAWLRNGQPISDGPGGASGGGGTVSGASGVLPAAPGGVLTLSIQGVGLGDAGDYRVRLNATRCGTVESNAASLSVAPEPGCPQFTASPGDASAVVGQTVSLTAQALIDAGATGTYQWLRNDVPVVNGAAGASAGGGVVSGAAGPVAGSGATASFTLLLVGTQLSDAGQYRLVIASPSCSGPDGVSSGTANLSVSEPPPPTPPSDLCAEAPTLVEGVYAFSTVDATTDGPDEPNACDFFGYTQVGSDVWFHYLPGCSGTATVSLCGSLYDTRLSMYQGDVCPTAPGTATRCNENGCPGTQQSVITFAATAGQRVLFRIGGFGGQQGEGTITISCGSVTPLPTDECELAPTVSEGTFLFSTMFASTDGPDEPNTCDFFGYTQVGSDVWLHYNPSCTGTATISLCNSSNDTRLAIYQGDVCPTVAGGANFCDEDGCNDSAHSRLTIPTVAGVSVLVRIGGFYGDQGEGQVQIACTPTNACRVDFNGDGFLDPDDLADYIGCFFTPPCAGADFNGDSFTDPDDLSDFISGYFAGC